LFPKFITESKEDGFTGLHIAATNGHAKVIQHLLGMVGFAP